MIGVAAKKICKEIEETLRPVRTSLEDHLLSEGFENREVWRFEPSPYNGEFNYRTDEYWQWHLYVNDTKGEFFFHCTNDDMWTNSEASLLNDGFIHGKSQGEFSEADIRYTIDSLQPGGGFLGIAALLSHLSKRREHPKEIYYRNLEELQERYDIVVDQPTWLTQLNKWNNGKIRGEPLRRIDFTIPEN